MTCLVEMSSCALERQMCLVGCMVHCGRLDNIEIIYTCDDHVLVYIYIHICIRFMRYVCLATMVALFDRNALSSPSVRCDEGHMLQMCFECAVPPGCRFRACARMHTQTILRPRHLNLSVKTIPLTCRRR